MSEGVTELEELFPRPVRVSVAGEEIEVREVTVGNLPDFLAALGRLMQALNPEEQSTQPGDYVEQLLVQAGRHVGSATALVAAGIGCDEEWVLRLRASDLIRALRAVLEANAGFFVEATSGLGQAFTLARGAGVMPSPASSPEATASRTSATTP